MFSFRAKRSNLIFFTVYCLLFIVLFSSCGNHKQDKQEVVSSNDSVSVPADLASLNSQIEKDRSNPDLYFKRAKYFFSQKKYQDAITDMNIVLKIDSTKATSYIFLSDLYLTQNKTKDTRDMLRKAIKLEPSNTEALLKYSELFFLAQKYDTAMFFVNRCLHYDKANASANFQKGMILKESGDTATAISNFQTTVGFDQNYYPAYMQLGILFSLKKNPLAIEYFDNALRIKPKSVEALYAKGKFLQDIGKYDKAIEQYDSLLAVSPENLDATFNIGAILFEQKKYDDAMKKFGQTISRDQNFYRGYYGRGKCFEAKGLKKKAQEDYKKCLAINPDFTLAARQLDFLDRH